MPYVVKEIYKTIQGEGSLAGRVAVFLRFAGCNLWSGREADRLKAVCQFCDTDFVGTDGPRGGTFSNASSLAAAVESEWGKEYSASDRFVVCTGGEPSLQLDAALVDALHDLGFIIGIETNGTRPLPENIDHVCVSPKANTELFITTGDDLKLVYPQVGAGPQSYEGLRFTNLYLQPCAGTRLNENTRLAIAYCLENPAWKLSVQMHKYLNIR